MTKKKPTPKARRTDAESALHALVRQLGPGAGLAARSHAARQIVALFDKGHVAATPYLGAAYAALRDVVDEGDGRTATQAASAVLRRHRPPAADKTGSKARTARAAKGAGRGSAWDSVEFGNDLAPRGEEFSSTWSVYAAPGKRRR